MARKNIRVQAVRRPEVDLDKLASALLLLIHELDASSNAKPEGSSEREPAA